MRKCSRGKKCKCEVQVVSPCRTCMKKCTFILLQAPLSVNTHVICSKYNVKKKEIRFMFLEGRMAFLLKQHHYRTFNTKLL